MNAKSEKSKAVAVQQETRRARVAPLMRFAELDDAFEVRLSLPGVTQEGLKVEIDNTIIKVLGRRSEATYDDARCVRQEFPLVDYEAAYELPEDVDREAISAQLAHGVLTLTLKKRAAAKPRQIKVAVA